MSGACDARGHSGALAGFHSRRRSRRICGGLLLTALVAACTAAPPPARRPAAALPLAAPVAVAPAGDARKPIVFAWNDDPAAPAGTIYRLTILDAAERVVAERQTRARRYDASAEIEAVFHPGASFTWQVAALDADGAVARQSAAVRFAIK